MYSCSHVTISFQDPEIITQLDRFEMALDHTSTMLSLLYITEELCDVSTSSEEGNASPQLDSADPDVLELNDNDGDDFDT